MWRDLALYVRLQKPRLRAERMSAFASFRSKAADPLAARPVQFEYEVWRQGPSRVANAPTTELAKARHASERRTLHSRHEGLLHPAPVSRPLQGRLHRRERDDSRAPR